MNYAYCPFCGGFSAENALGLDRHYSSVSHQTMVELAREIDAAMKIPVDEP